MLSALQAYLDRSRQVLAVVVVTALAALVVINGLSIAMRTVGLGSLHWAHEISIVLALCVYFMSYGLVIRSQAEIRVEFLSRRLPGPAHRMLRLVGDVMQLALYIFMGYLAWRYALRASVLAMPMTDLSEAWTFIPVLLGFADSAIVIVLRFLVGAPKGAGASAPPEEV